MRYMVQHATMHMLPYPTDRSNSCGPTYMYMYVLTSATDSFNIHTSLVWLDSSLSLCMHLNGNYNGNYHVCTHAICEKGLAKLDYIHNDCTLWL